MASHPDFVNYMAEQLREAGAIRSRKMFGEYGLYCDDVFFAVVCDDQLFVKVTPQGEACLLYTSYEKSPSEQAAAVLLHLVKKGSLTKCKATGRLEVNGNSKSKVVKK